MASIDFSKKISSLPPPLKTLFYSDEVGLALKDALKLANLEEKRYFSPIMDLIAQLLVLDISLEEFSIYLSDKLSLNQAQQQIIEKVLKDKILNPVLPLLKQKPLFKQEPQTNKKISQKESLKIPFTPLSVPPLKLKEKISKGKPPIKNASLKETFKEELTSQETNKELHKEIPKEKEEKIGKEKIKIPPREIPEPKKILPQSLLSQKGEKELSKGNQNKKISQQPKEEIPKVEIPKAKEMEFSVPEIKIPEPLEIKIEEPLEQKIDIKPISVPEVSPEKQEKIKEALFKTMTSRIKETPSIVEEMKKVEKTPLPSKESQSREKKERAVKETEEISEVITGKNNTFLKETKTMPKAKTSSILDIKIKETEQKEKEIPETIQKPIEYKKPEKPFGET